MQIIHIPLMLFYQLLILSLNIFQDQVFPEGSEWTHYKDVSHSFLFLIAWQLGLIFWEVLQILLFNWQHVVCSSSITCCRFTTLNYQVQLLHETNLSIHLMYNYKNKDF